MSSFKSILCALDESERRTAVFSTAATMARAFQSRLHLVRVIVVPPDLPPAAHTHPDGLEGLLERQARQELRTLMDREPGIDFGPPVVAFGDPWHRILGVARGIDADLIVIGNHRYRGLARVLGTVASKIVNHANRHVLVVQEPISPPAP